MTSSNVNCSVVYSYSTTNSSLTNYNSLFGAGYYNYWFFTFYHTLLAYDKNQNTFNLSCTSNYYGDTNYNITVVAKFNLGTNQN